MVMKRLSPFQSPSDQRACWLVSYLPAASTAMMSEEWNSPAVVASPESDGYNLQ